MSNSKEKSDIIIELKDIQMTLIVGFSILWMTSIGQCFMAVAK